ncbi:MAG: hypothetical protein IPM41_13995 [Sphingomonadales bacterium]|nr:hypothetical protein [Sphingomonadales bacterium]
MPPFRDAKLRVQLELAALLGADEIDEDVLDRAQQIDPTASIDGHHVVFTINGTAARRGSTQSAPRYIIDDSERRRLLADLIRKSHRQLEKLNASPLHPDEHVHACRVRLH